MGNRLVPNKEIEFLQKAESLASVVSAEPEKFGVPPEDARAMQDAAVLFRAAYQAAFSGNRTRTQLEEKQLARAQAKRQFIRCVNFIRMNESVDAAARQVAGIKDRPKRLKASACPQEPPKLRFMRALHEGNGATPMHELDFRALDWKSKPPGAVRLELFVDLIPPDEPIPVHPGANHGSRPWYLRSYTRSPIKLIPPMARVPMRVVYWGRWADSQGNVGPFSATAAAWIEGGSNCNLPGGVGISIGNLNGPKPVPILEDARPVGPESRNESYRIAIIEVQSQSMNPRNPDAALPAPAEARQLEGPAEREAA